MARRRWAGAGGIVTAIGVSGISAALVLGALGSARGAPAQDPAASESLPDCLLRLERARRTQSELEPAFVEGLYPPKLFAAGQPNPGAQAALLPVLERALKAGAGVPELSLTLECHTWACRMLVVQPRGTETSGWEKALVAPELHARIRDTAVAARRRTADALGGHDLMEATVFLKLADPSGQPRPPDAGPEPRARSTSAPPATAALCATEIDKVERVNTAMRNLLTKSLTPAQRFRQEPPNEPLTRDMASQLRQATASLPSSFAGLTLQCRGVVCQVKAPSPLDRGAWNQLEARPELSARIVGKAYDTDAYWLVRPAEKADGLAVLNKLLAQLEAQPFFEQCHAKNPAKGYLIVGYLLQGDSVFGQPGGRKGDRAATGDLTAVYSGSLVDTPLGRCVSQEIDRALTSMPLPPERLRASAERRYDWPRRR
jgi:hypothetical protein